MSDRFLVATRKGLFTFERGPGRVSPWSITATSFLGDNVSWALEAGGDGDPDGLWCGTIPGGLFRSDDRGKSWQLVRSLWDHPKRREWFGGGAEFPGIHSICVEPGDGRRVA